VADEQDENQPPAPKRRRTRKFVRKSVAELAGLNGRVTSRVVAYIAVMVRLRCPSSFLALTRLQFYASLTNMSQWTDNWQGVSLPQMYNFIVDFFDEPEAGTAARKRADELLDWWSECVIRSSRSITTHSLV
jgi:hypothetical protein